MDKFIKGMDVSVLKEMETLGAKYYVGGNRKDLLDILKENGTTMIRLRLWHDPYTEDGKSYGAGGNDLRTTIELAKRVKEKGMEFLLDIHYSDFWTDPAKQFLPKAWRGMDEEQLEEEVCRYTQEVMGRLKEHQVAPDMVQVGNELTNGLLWPNGRKPAYDRMQRLINAGIRGVRMVDRDVPIMLHLDNGSDEALYEDWFSHFMNGGEEFQYIGMSYYPIWNGPLSGLISNMQKVNQRFGKEIIIAEVAAPFTLEDYAAYEELGEMERKGMATKPELAEKLEYPATIDGQKDFMLQFLEEVSATGICRGFFYWEPGWLPVKGSGWANKYSLAYMGDPGPGGNEWANQCLFDYEGNALPALEVVRDFNNPNF